MECHLPAAREQFQSAVLIFGENTLVPTRFEVLMLALVEDMPLVRRVVATFRRIVVPSCSW
jgi:hypothetical protein